MPILAMLSNVVHSSEILVNNNGYPPPPFFISVDYEEIKVICFDTDLQVLLLNGLGGGSFRVEELPREFRRKAWARGIF
jgi:hypothetical protein